MVFLDASLFMFGSVMVVIWPLGLPAFLLYTLRGVSKDILAEDEDVLEQVHVPTFCVD